MFDEVTKREGGKRAARRGVWVAVSSAVQALLVVGVIVVSTKIAAEVAREPTVDVKFVKAAPPPPPPPPAAPPRKTPPKPRPDQPAQKPNPMAMVQPKDVQEEMKPPDPGEPPEEAGEGVEGGVIGGVAGGVPGPATGQPGGIVDAPVYAIAGFRKPAEAERGCVAQSVRMPSDVLERLAGSVTVKFAIGRDGAPSQFQVMSATSDPRVSQAIWQAVQSCRWLAGADAQGRPIPIWMIMPIRFAID